MAWNPFNWKANTDAARAASFSRYQKDADGNDIQDEYGQKVINPNFNKYLMGGDQERQTAYDDYLLSLDEGKGEATAFEGRVQDFKAAQNRANTGRTLENLKAGDAGDYLSNLAGSETEAAALNAVGNLGGMALKGLGAAMEGQAAAQAAGEAVEARNNQARAAILGQAQADTRDMNQANARAGRQMNNAALQAGNVYDAGMAGIATSGIEGSANMERNLQYDLDNAAAGAADEFAMMNDRAQDYENAMANRFSQLQQDKAAAMQGAYGNVINNANAGITQARARAGEYGKMMPNTQDYQALFQPGSRTPAEVAAAKAERAALEPPDPAAAPAAALGGMTEYEARMKQFAPTPATPAPAPPITGTAGAMAAGQNLAGRLASAEQGRAAAYRRKGGN